MATKLRRVVTWVAAGTGIAAVGLIAHLSYIHLTGNFDTLVPGEVYRSAQMVGTDLQDYAAEHGIKSVLNLRGATANADWYTDEVAESARLGLVHANFAMSASERITPEQVFELIALMRSLPKPMLIHCRQGSDRTGLASALYLAAISGAEEDTAEAQLSLYYGHFAVPYLSDAYPMDETWEVMEAVLGFPNS